MTNREWVSNLSDEQRANFTSDIGTSGSIETCEACPVFEFCFNYCQDKEVMSCAEIIRAWLKEEIREKKDEIGININTAGMVQEDSKRRKDD